MAVRIAGVTIPMDKHTIIGLQAIYGIGPTRSAEVCKRCSVDPSVKIKNLTEEELESLRQAIGLYQPLEGDLRRETSMNIKRLMDIGCVRGRRHRSGLPVRGQRTKTNARTRKGKKKTKK